MIIKLAKNLHDDIAVLIDDIPIRPTVGRIRLPGCTFLIGHNWPRQTELLCRSAHIVDVEPNTELSVMHPDHVQSELVILAIPALDHSEVAYAVDAGVLPEIDENNMTAIFGNVVRNW